MNVKLVTLNINHGGELIDTILEFLAKEQPDIFLVQEAYSSTDSSLEKRFQSMQVFENRMRTSFSAFLPAYHDGDVDIDRGNGIISKFPISNIGGMVFNSAYRTIYDEANIGDWTDQPRVIQTCEIVINDRKINIVNVHGIWDFHGRDSEKRIEQSKLILQQIQNKEDLILAGDFNMNPDTKAIKLIADQLTPVFGNELETTFNMKKKTNPDFGHAVVDMIFTSSSIKITNKYCPSIDISDHLPLIVEFEV